MKPLFHLRSMTAFGRGEALATEGRFVCELHSVNRRHLDLEVTTPRSLRGSEGKIRSYLTQKIGRGEVSCAVRWEVASPHLLGMEPNLPFALALKEGWQKLTKALLMQNAFPTELLLAYPEQLWLSSSGVSLESVLPHVLEACTRAYEALDAVKSYEGEQLANDLFACIQQLCEGVEQVAARAPHIVSHYRTKLLERLKEVGEMLAEDPRILKEVALFADKVDIAEEIVRLKSHLGQFEGWLVTPLREGQQTKGKMGEFLIQEILREVNTMGSKANDLMITQSVLNMKNAVERMREQIQNVE